MIKLAILSTHPIQYNAPLFRLLAQDKRLIVKVFYTLGKDSSGFTDPGFGRTISWDIPLLDGYDFKFISNKASKPTTGSFSGIVNPTLIQEIESFGATHLLLYSWAFHSHLKVMRYFKGKTKILFRGDSTLLDEQQGVRTLLRRLWLRWVYKHIDIALYVGTNNKKYYLKHGVAANKLVFAPHAIDNDRFSSILHANKAKELRQQLKIDQNKKVFLFVGKFVLKKNPLILIKAFLNISKHNAVLLMVGNGALEQELKQLAAGTEHIKFLPFQNQSMMPAVYKIADVLVLPSQGPGETWGLSMNEAMASGLSVIASDKVGGAIDLIEKEMNGFIFESNNLEQLTNILDHVATMPEFQLRQMGQYSQLIIKNWSLQQINSIILNTIIA